MSWFTDQIKEREQRDRSMLAEAFSDLNVAISGRRYSSEALDEQRLIHGALNDILRAMHFPEMEIPEQAVSLEEQMQYALHPHGIMWRPVVMEKGWYRNAVGPMLTRRKDDGAWVALMPGRFSSYHYIDPKSGEHIRITRKNEDSLEQDGYCFYTSFPARSLGVPDLIKYIFKTIAPSTYIFMAVVTVLITLLGLLTPRITYLMFSSVLESRSMRLLLSIAVFSVCVSVSSLLMNTVRTVMNDRLNTQLNMSVQAATMARIINLPSDFFRGNSAGELANKMESVKSLCSSMVSSVFSLGLSSLFSFIYVFQIGKYAPSLVVPSLLITLVTIVHTIIITLMQIRVNEKRMNLSAKLDGMTFGLIAGIQKIKLSGSEKRALAKWLGMFSEQMKLTYRLPFLLMHAADISLAISLIGQFVLYYIATNQQISIAEYTAFNSAYGMVSGAFMSLVSIASTLGQIRPILRIAEPIMKAIPENGEQKKIVKEFSGYMELSHVTFRYNENTPAVVNDLSLKIQRGQYVAIVGKTGCGKSTLVRLLLGFEKPEKGGIYYDHKDLRTLDLHSLRQSIGTVMQDGKLMADTIRDNITVAAPTATLDDAWEAAETVGLADDIRDMPMGMNTVIPEGGGGISGGQRQRILIARAIVGKPKILILDEATSALDNITQKKVSDALDQLKCTRIVIAHRLSTIRQCDRILYLEDGRIVEDGSYDELIALNGRFADLVARQQVEQ